MRHVIDIPDVLAGREIRGIVWDDEAGAVEGDHYQVARLREFLEQEPPIDGRFMEGLASRLLHDSRHAPADFLALLTRGPYWRLLEGMPWHHHLPPSLRGVAPTPGIPLPDDPNTVY